MNAAHAQDQAKVANRPTVIEEVIVTVTKRAESVQDVGASVAAFSGTVTEDFNLGDLDKIGEVLPNVNVRNQSNISIRGVGRGLTNGSPVATHENGLFVQDGAMTPFYDLAAIEVIRGPSGTVYGRNATGGALNVKWAEPSDEYEVGGDIQRASFEQEQIRVYANAPIGDRGALRGVFLRENRDEGDYDDLTSRGRDDPSGILQRLGRLYFRYDLSDNLRISARAAQENKSKNYFIASPSESTRRSGILEELGAQPLPANDLTIVRSSVQALGEPEQDRKQLAFDVNWSLPSLSFLGPVDISVLAGGYELFKHEIIDLDGTEVAILDTDSFLDIENTNVELRFVSAGESPLRWILGFFHARNVEDAFRILDARLKVNLGALFPGTPGADQIEAIADIDGTQDEDRLSTSNAVFASAEFSLQQWLGRGPDIELFGGLRQNEDRFAVKGSSLLILTRAEDPNTGAAFPTPPAPVSDVMSDFDESFSQLTGEFGARWHLNDASMAYAKYARGYKPGFAEQLDGGGLNILEPEILDALEIGYKTRLLGGAMILNSSVFLYDYKNLQVQQFIGTTLFTENAADSTIYGAEVDMQVRPTENLTVVFSLGFLNASYDEFCSQDPFRPKDPDNPDPGCGGDTPLSLADNDTPDAPRFSANLLLSYDWPLDRWGVLTPALKYSWKNDFFTRPYNLDEDVIDAYGKTDLRLSWRSPDSHYEVELFVENIEDEDQIFLNPVFFGQEGAIGALTHRPGRFSGLRLGFSF